MNKQTIEVPSDRRRRWTLEAERDDIRLKLDWYTNVLQEPKITMKQFMALARERNQLSVRLCEIKKMLEDLRTKKCKMGLIKNTVPHTVSIPTGVRLGR